MVLCLYCHLYEVVKIVKFRSSRRSFKGKYVYGNKKNPYTRHKVYVKRVGDVRVRNYYRSGAIVADK